MQFQVHASERIPDAHSLESAHIVTDFKYFEHPCIGLLGQRLFWQKGLSVAASLRSGDVLVVSGNPRFLSNYPLIWQAKQRSVGD
jgi:hypothetical protein